jgi:hypothetical protein
MILSPTELILVNFDGLVRTTDLGSCAPKKPHNVPAEHASVSYSFRTEAIFTLDKVRLFAVHDAIRKKYCFEKSKITLLEPGSVPDRQGSTTPDNSIPRETSPTKSIRACGVNVARHISAASVTRNLTPNQFRVLQKTCG